MISHTLRAMTFRGCETTRSAANASGRRSAAAGRPPISPKRRAPKKAMAQMIAMTGASTHTISDGVAPRPAAQPSSPMKFSTGVKLRAGSPKPFGCVASRAKDC